MALHRTARCAPLALLALLACNEKTQYATAPLNRFLYPTAVAVRHVVPHTSTPCPAGSVGVAGSCQTQLLVASSNADLRFDPASGGSVIAVDVDAALVGYDGSQGPPQPADDVTPFTGELGGAHVGSFTGELAVADASTCSTWSGTPQVLVASRSENALYRLALDAEGRPQAWDPAAASCAASCKVPLHGPVDAAGASILQVRSPYGVGLACGNFPDATGTVAARAYAFTTFLEGEFYEGGLQRLDLADASAPGRIPLVWRDLGVSPTRSVLFDAPSSRLYVTSVFGAYGWSPLRWLALDSPSSGYSSVNVETVLRGAEPRSMALSTDRTQAYVAVRIFDTSAAAYATARPVDDIAGALVVYDLSVGTNGQPRFTPVDVVPLDRGATEVRVIPRTLTDGTALPDLVAILSEADHRLTLWDAATGTVAWETGTCPDASGAPATAGGTTPPAPCTPGMASLGAQPAGLAVEMLDRAADASGRQLARVYVASYDRAWVNVITFDPLHPDLGPTALVPAADPSHPRPAWARLGPERLW